MARPREFDEDEVLDRALALFWSKGYEATSIQDLVEATGLNRASLYGAFGDKEAIFRRVLDHYVARTPKEAVEPDERCTVRGALEKMLHAQLNATCAKAGPRGCFLQIAAMARDDTPWAREMMQASLARFEKTFERLIERGQASGEVDPERDPAALARLLVLLLQGVSTTARGGWGRERLGSAISEALDLVIPPRKAAPG